MMSRGSFASLALACPFLLVGVIAPSARAASWTDSVLPVREHDFGNVRRGTELHYAFPLVNRSDEPLRISRIRVSCGCTEVRAPAQDVPPGGTANLDTVVHTDGFQGAKSVTIFVQFDKPRRREAKLRVSLVSVGDPGVGATEIDFGILSEGTKQTRKVHLDYSGNADWRIVDVQHGNPAYHVEVVELERTRERVRYDLELTVDTSGQRGNLPDTIRLSTNDAKRPLFEVTAMTAVEAEIALAPSSFRLSDSELRPGEEVTRQFFLKADEPFRLLRVENTEGYFRVRSAPTESTTQLVVITLDVPADPTVVPDHLELVTSLQDGKMVMLPIAKP